MKTGYDQFFKQARNAADSNSGVANSSRNSQLNKNSHLSEEQLRKKFGMLPTKQNKRKSSWKIISISIVGIAIAIWGLENYEKIDLFISKIEVGLYSEASAKETSPDVKKTEDSKTPAAEPVEMIQEEHLVKLNERKKELDLKEEELKRIESELNEQKLALETKMKELEDMRRNISSVLEEQVKVDEQKIDNLVQMYTNMKAPQAAKIFETMDENLAVEILVKMKKKNAAEIMNLLKPEKAQVFSEKYAGFKSK